MHENITNSLKNTRSVIYCSTTNMFGYCHGGYCHATHWMVVASSAMEDITKLLTGRRLLASSAMEGITKLLTGRWLPASSAMDGITKVLTGR